MKNLSAIIINLIIIISLLLISPITIQIVYGGECGPKFPIKKCSCGELPYDGKMQYIVNCTNAGFDDTNVLEYMPEQTQILIFTGNNIPELPWNVFGTLNDYSSLTVVDMTNNHIKEIRGKSYHHVSNVKRLILNHNNLSISRNSDDVNYHHPRVFSNFINLESLHLTNAFEDNSSPSLSKDLHDIFVNSNLTKLQKLHLEQNEISHFLDHKVFCDLPSLRDLYLGDNNLKEINFNIKCLKHLRFLDFERNKFEYLKIKDLNILNELDEIPASERTTSLVVDFNLNPFKCDCNLNPFYEWLKTTKITIRNKEKLYCLRNNIHKELIIDGGGSNEFGICLKNIEKSKGHTTTLVFLLVVLGLILIGLLSALIYVSRDKLKPILTPVLDNVSKKVQYTTIKDEECPEVHV